MADDRPAVAAGSRPAFEFEAGYEAGRIYVNVKIDRPWLAFGMVAAGIATIAALHHINPTGVRTAVRMALAGLVDRVVSIRPGSVLVDLCFNTKQRFLTFMHAFVTGTVKERFQEEFSKIGFKDELQVTVTVYGNASQMRQEMEEVGAEIVESGIGSIASGCITFWNVLFTHAKLTWNPSCI